MNYIQHVNLIDWNISHDEFVLLNNVAKKLYDIKEEIINSNDKQEFKLYIKQCYLNVWNVERNTESKNPKLLRTKNGWIIFFENFQCVIVYNRNFLKNKKLEDY